LFNNDVRPRPVTHPSSQPEQNPAHRNLDLDAYLLIDSIGVIVPV
jgi:hypothetical protein